MSDPIGWIVLQHQDSGVWATDPVHASLDAALADCQQANDGAEKAGVPTVHTVAALVPVGEGA